MILTSVFLSACATGKSSETQRVEAQPVAHQLSSREEKIAEFNKSVFCLSVVHTKLQDPKRRAMGTAFLVSDNLFATALHVKQDLDRQMNQSYRLPEQIMAWKKFEDGEYFEIPIKFVAADTESDIALFSFQAEGLKEIAQKRGIKPIQLADRLPAIGEDILSIGYYGLIESPFNSLGTVSNIEKGEDIYADMTLMPGNSGGPLISMKTGEVIGINIKVMTIGDGTMRLGISKKISKLRDLIENNKN